MHTVLDAPTAPGPVVAYRAAGADADADASNVRFAEAAPSTAVAVAEDVTTDLLGAVVALDEMVASIQATRAKVINAVIEASALTVSEPGSVAGRALRLRSVRAELAAAMRIPERTAERMLVTSEFLVHALPDTLAAMAEGRVSYRHAEALVQEAETLEPEAIARLRTPGCRMRRRSRWPSSNGSCGYCAKQPPPGRQ